jgi:anhydro-N-acetylmuramic acid kinase
MIAVGLMSGTSLDGLDAALVRIVPRGGSYDIVLMNFVTLPFEEQLERDLRAALPPNPGSVAMLATLHHRLGEAFAQAARAAAGDLRVDFVASHGQTLFHDGAAHVTLQIADPFVMRERLQATICYDFRSADCAAGGQGAPLVPYVDALLVADALEDRVALNLGGIANLTALPRGCVPDDALAFDCGPGVMLIDAFVRARSDGTRTFDADGALAAAGTVDHVLLAAMLADSYFVLVPPKSTGREHFGTQFLAAHAPMLDALSCQDGAATLTELTAAAVADAVRGMGMARSRIVCSGGGARNATLLRRIAQRLPDACVETSEGIGLHGDAKEAMAFAVLGYETLRGRAANLPRVTGATRGVPLGAIAPYELQRLIAEVENECRSS